MKDLSIGNITSRLARQTHEMNAFINRDSVQPPIRERLQEQLGWLSHQTDLYCHNGDTRSLAERYDWVVDEFNSRLNLIDEEKIGRASCRERV